MPQNVYRYKNSSDLTDNTITNGKFECIFRTVEIYVIAVDISVDDGGKNYCIKLHSICWFPCNLYFFWCSEKQSNSPKESEFVGFRRETTILLGSFELYLSLHFMQCSLYLENAWDNHKHRFECSQVHFKHVPRIFYCGG